MLEGYADDTRPLVIDELYNAWDFFDREAYAKWVLSQTLRSRTDLHLRLEGFSSLDSIQYFTNLTALNLLECAQVNNLNPLVGLTQLLSLNLSRCFHSNILNVIGLTSLKSLTMSHCFHLITLNVMSLTQLRSLS